MHTLTRNDNKPKRRQSLSLTYFTGSTGHRGHIAVLPADRQSHGLLDTYYQP